MKKTFYRIFGGPPLTIIGQLLLYSLICGIILSAAGYTPISLLQRLMNWFLSLFNMGGNIFYMFGHWLMSGAMLIIPLWLVIRIIKRR